MANHSTANNFTVSGSVNSELWSWIEKTRGKKARRTFVRECIEFSKKMKYGGAA